MYKNTNRMNEVNLNKPVRSIKRSDGCSKVFGWTLAGGFVTVTMAPGMDGLDIVAVKIRGHYVYHNGRRAYE